MLVRQPRKNGRKRADTRRCRGHGVLSCWRIDSWRGLHRSVEISRPRCPVPGTLLVPHGPMGQRPSYPRRTAVLTWLLLAGPLWACGGELDVVIRGGRVMDPESGLDASRRSFPPWRARAGQRSRRGRRGRARRGCAPWAGDHGTRAVLRAGHGGSRPMPDDHRSSRMLTPSTAKIVWSVMSRP